MIRNQAKLSEIINQCIALIYKCPSQTYHLISHLHGSFNAFLGHWAIYRAVRKARKCASRAVKDSRNHKSRPLYTEEMQIWSTALIPVSKWSYRGETQTWSTALNPVQKERRRSEVRLWSPYRSEATEITWSTVLIPVRKERCGFEVRL